MGLDAQVADARALVVLGSPPPLAVRGVEDVGDAQVGQLAPVGCYISAENQKQCRDVLNPDRLKEKFPRTAVWAVLDEH